MSKVTPEGEALTVIQADRDAAAEWAFIECRHCSQYEGDFVSDLAEDFARHRLSATRNTEVVEVERVRAECAMLAEDRRFDIQGRARRALRDAAEVLAALSSYRKGCGE